MHINCMKQGYQDWKGGDRTARASSTPEVVPLNMNTDSATDEEEDMEWGRLVSEHYSEEECPTSSGYYPGAEGETATVVQQDFGEGTDDELDETAAGPLDDTRVDPTYQPTAASEMPGNRSPYNLRSRICGSGESCGSLEGPPPWME